MTKPTLAGHQIVITGQPETFSRGAARQMIEDAGGEIAGAVGLHTTILLVCPGGHPVSGRKLEHARLLGVQIMDEPEFLKLLAGQ